MKDSDEMKCPECGESILSRRLGRCPACRTELPEHLSLTESESKLLDKEFDHAKRAVRRASRPDHDEEGSGLSSSGPRNYIGDVE